MEIHVHPAIDCEACARTARIVDLQQAIHGLLRPDGRTLKTQALQDRDDGTQPVERVVLEVCDTRRPDPICWHGAPAPLLEALTECWNAREEWA